jgi:hypothetical protein
MRMYSSFSTAPARPEHLSTDCSIAHLTEGACVPLCMSARQAVC